MWSHQEDALNQGAQAAYGRPQELNPAGRALSEVSNRAALFFRDQHKSCVVSKCITCTRKLQLHLGGPGRVVVEAFAAAFPW